MKPTPYEVEKLAGMTRRNEAELATIKADRAAGKPIEHGRVRNLARAVKVQIKLERDLQRREAKP